MTLYSVRSYLKIALVVGVLLMLSACAPQNKQSTIEERVNARWDALLAGNLAGAYEYLSPGYRSSVSSLQYQRKVLLQQIKYTSAKYVSSKCEKTTCNVTVLVGFTVYGALPGVKSFDGSRNIDESWVLVDGNWYVVPEK
jgi:hypothetical protein